MKSSGKMAGIAEIERKRERKNEKWARDPKV